jgi:hypothetical protein
MQSNYFNVAHGRLKIRDPMSSGWWYEARPQPVLTVEQAERLGLIRLTHRPVWHDEGAGL